LVQNKHGSPTNKSSFIIEASNEMKVCIYRIFVIGYEVDKICPVRKTIVTCT
jgi:hypothetical protein